MSMTNHAPANRAPRRRLAMATGALLLALALSGCGVFSKGQRPETPVNGDRIPILSHIATVIKPDPALANVSVVLPPPQTNKDWPQAGGNAAKAPGNLTLAANPTELWSASIAGTSNTRRLAASPVTGGGLLYAVDTDGVVHALNAETGAPVWTYNMYVPGELKDAVFGGGATYYDGRVYATSGTGDVVALNAKTGAEVWRQKPAGPLRGSPTVAFNTVYVMTQDNQIHALAIDTGDPVWQDAAAAGESGVFGVAAPAAGQGTVIAGYSTGELVAYRYENGRNLWSDALARTSISTSVGSLTDVDADPIISKGQVFALGVGGRMAAYELTTGQRFWELTLAGISTPSVAGEWVFTLTENARILAITRATGQIRWVTQLDEWRKPKKQEKPIFWTGPVLASNRLWIASSYGDVKWVDATNGQVHDFTHLKHGVYLAPIVANNTLYILDNGGRITAWR